MAKVNEIIEFIKRRWQKDADWVSGNCYWFSKILCERFPDLKIWYCPVIGHFVAGCDGKFYDWNGEYEPQEKPILFEDIKRMDFLWYAHIVRDCVM